jgi:hypothetical protein
MLCYFKMWIYLVCSSYCELIYKERLKAGSFGMVQENSMHFIKNMRLG